MSKPLIIVESPAKARTIAGFLGSGYVVESSIGHIRDLPRNAAEIPAAYREKPWSKLGVDVENAFKPLYVVPREKKEQIKKLKAALEEASEVYLATDEDREGESIAWHLLEVLKPKVPVRRMVFHEITPEAIRRALEQPRDIDERLVEAQEARRILDRLYGYEVSPVLWKKVQPKLSAGRVQSVAVRVIVDRERERMAFRSGSFWDLEGLFRIEDGDGFTATMILLDGKRLATGKDFSDTGELTGDILLLDEAAAVALAGRLTDAAMHVRSVTRKPYRRSPYPPFRTSTLQQEAGRKLRFGTSRTMRAAQRLYENGYITYMRTDNTDLSETAVEAARRQIADLYGKDYVPVRPRTYKSKVKNAQEAHEAIRPTGHVFRTPEQIAAEIDGDEAAVYELIWKRTIASQMADAVGESVQVRLGGTSSAGENAEFATSGRVIQFPGFLRAYVEGSDDPDADLDDQERRLPPLAENDPLHTDRIEAKGHETKPPPRFTEASLVRRLEELGVGRPSTYASIITTIQDRGYVWKKASAMVPSFTAFAKVTLLERHFPNLVDYAFTARMERDLDLIARGEEASVPWLGRFYFGNGSPGLHNMVTDRLADIDAREINSIPIGTDPEGAKIVARAGRYGPYLQRGEDTASIPDQVAPDELTVEKAIELLSAPSGDRELGADPETGLPVSLRTGRFGPYVQLGEQEETAKPKRASLFKSMDPEEVTLEVALQLLSLPRVVGADPADAMEITAMNGRYGPYVKKGDETRSLENEEQLLTVTLDEALVLLSQPKRRRGQQTAAPFRELGVDPVSGKPVVLKSGRYGPYVTDGEVNGSLRKGDDPDTISLERAAELLQARRDRQK
ncbi:MAG: type I DNA topoisomerase [Acidimicrobiia bacterium]|nr:type I DNA topoisomerase [Acidimicrobiia bacterium]MDH3397600.1 type I DNA topoisomerase [Acidimicrobiia bacterium]